MKLNNSALQELYDTITTGTFVFTPSGTDPVDEAFKECDDKLSESITFEHIKNLQDRNDLLEQSNKHLLEANMESISKTRKIEKEIEDAKKQVKRLTQLRDRWWDRTKHSEKEVEDLKERNQLLESSRLVWALKANERGKKLNEAEQKIEELTKNIQDLSIKLKRCQINVGRESRFLWDMLQKVNDAKPFELATCFPDVTCMDDILSWNLEDFLDAYEKWHGKKEQERIDHMRGYLARFCTGRLCIGCPLESSEYKCRSAYWFRDKDSISDEDVERYYEKARGCDATWECTLEAKVEIDQDLLNKICGIDSDEIDI